MDPWSKKIAYATEQVSLSTLEPELHKRSHPREKPEYHSEEQPATLHTWRKPKCSTRDPVLP